MSINRKQLAAVIAGAAFVMTGVLGVAAPAQAAPGDAETTVQMPGFCRSGAPIFDQPAGMQIDECTGAPVEVYCQTASQGADFVKLTDRDSGVQGYAFKQDVQTPQEPPQC